MKEINDRGGHAEGDHLLQACAQTMQRVLGEVARLYRVGGDEFVATVVDTDEAGFRSLVERLQKAFDEVPSCEVAIGAQWTPRSSEIDRTLFDADEAMYRDKRRFYQNRSTSDVAPSRRARGDRFDERERAKARDVAQEGTLMELLGIGFARHRLDEAFTTLESNACYSLVTGDDEEGRRAVGALAKEAREAGERGFAGTVCVNRGGAPARVRVSGAFAETRPREVRWRSRPTSMSKMRLRPWERKPTGPRTADPASRPSRARPSP